MASPQKTYRMIGGDTITGATPQELAADLRASSRNPQATPEAFMVKTAENCRMYSGAEIRTGNEADFIADLIASEFLVDAAQPLDNVLHFSPPAP